MQTHTLHDKCLLSYTRHAWTHPKGNTHTVYMHTLCSQIFMLMLQLMLQVMALARNFLCCELMSPLTLRLMKQCCTGSTYFSFIEEEVCSFLMGRLRLQEIVLFQVSMSPFCLHMASSHITTTNFGQFYAHAQKNIYLDLSLGLTSRHVGIVDAVAKFSVVWLKVWYLTHRTVALSLRVCCLESCAVFFFFRRCSSTFHVLKSEV